MVLLGLWLRRVAAAADGWLVLWCLSPWDARGDAVMAGDARHPDETRALLEQAEALNHAHSCPHGRPTRLVLSRRDLERSFHRTG